MFRWDTGGGCLRIICLIAIGFMGVSYLFACIIGNGCP